MKKFHEGIDAVQVASIEGYAYVEVTGLIEIIKHWDEARVVRMLRHIAADVDQLREAEREPG